MKPIDEMTRKEILACAERKWELGEVLKGVHSVVLVPTRRKHDSGFLSIRYLACLKDRYVLCGGGDVIHVEGIGGYKASAGLPRKFPPSWTIDCLPGSGLLRLFIGHGSIVCGADLSSMEIWSEEKK